MSDSNSEARSDEDSQPPAVAPTAEADKRPATAEPRLLPPWKVLLHNDEINAQPEVVEAIVTIAGLSRAKAVERMLEAHFKGVSLLLTTHRERAELHVVQFMRRNLTVTIEPV